MLTFLSLFYFTFSDWDAEYGGFTSYIAKGEDEEVSSMVYSILKPWPADLSLGAITIWHSARAALGTGTA